MFLKGKAELSYWIRRTKFKGDGPRKPASPYNEPNFYSMPPVGNEDEASVTCEVAVEENCKEAGTNILDTTSFTVDPLNFWEASSQHLPSCTSCWNTGCHADTSTGTQCSILDYLVNRSYQRFGTCLDDRRQENDGAEDQSQRLPSTDDGAGDQLETFPSTEIRQGGKSSPVDPLYYLSSQVELPSQRHSPTSIIDVEGEDFCSILEELQSCPSFPSIEESGVELF